MLLICSLASSLFKHPSPSQYNILAASLSFVQVSTYASNRVSFVLFGISLPLAYRMHLSMTWNTTRFL